MRRQAQGPSVVSTPGTAVKRCCDRRSASRGPRLAALLIVLAALCAALAPSASAADKQVVSAIGGEGQTGGLFTAVRGVAVNSSGAGGVPAGTVYAVDSRHRVEQFSPTGVFVRAWGQDVVASGPGNTGTGFEICVAADGDVCQGGVNTATSANGGDLATPQGVAVDQSTGAGQFGFSVGYPAVDPVTGDVVVADSSNRRVQRLSGAGAFVSAFGWGVSDGGSSLQTCTVTCLAGVAGAGSGQFGSGSPTSVAVDAAGRVYAVESFGNPRVQRFDAGGTSATVFAGAVVSAARPPEGVAVDAASGDAYVTVRWSSPSERRVVRLSAADVVLETYGVGGGISATTGSAFDAASGNVYLSVTAATQVLVLNAPVPPVGVAGDATDVTAHAMTLNGTVDPNGYETGYHFEYSGDEGASWSRAPAFGEVSAGGGADPVAVAQPVSGLAPNAEYLVRLVVTKRFNPAVVGAVRPVRTALGRSRT